MRNSIKYGLLAIVGATLIVGCGPKKVRNMNLEVYANSEQRRINELRVVPPGGEISMGEFNGTAEDESSLGLPMGKFGSNSIDKLNYFENSLTNPPIISPGGEFSMGNFTNTDSGVDFDPGFPTGPFGDGSINSRKIILHTITNSNYVLPSSDVGMMYRRD